MRSVPLSVRGFAVVVGVVLGWGLAASPALAGTADPYLDAIAPDSTVVITDAAAMLGAPDGRYATVQGQFGRQLVVDLGAGEEGVGDLEVAYVNPPGTLSQQLWVDFLDGNGRKVGEGYLLMIGTSARTAVVSNSATQSYRYLRMVTEVRTYRFDSMKTAALASSMVGAHHARP
ncbi:hypothetical protein [Labedaea rhizosphaerae]|uniref:Uncharacterized protein n=1 Tax=Labedaea rhizosphaerae TaxID=598644 RepID=A0A4R6SFY8_LABRH|nr:hypothetical protein [Labedaea rhizosphaerae]TDQ00430.1 hypothetical protein EV186_102291 [Labedaea rhizosphaerae]